VGGAAGTGAVGPIGQGGSSGGGIAMCSSPTLPNGKCVIGAFMHAGSGCACQESAPCACPDVGCVDPMTDVANCGVCAVRCGPTSTCNGGVCGPTPLTESAPIPGCHAMTMVATNVVYFTDADNGTVNMVGVAKPLAMYEMGPTFLEMSGTSLYWYAKGSKKIRTMAITGGAVTDVFTVTSPDGGAPDGGAPLDVAGFLVSPDGANIYISLGTQVLEAPVAGGGASVVVNEAHLGRPAALALNGTANIVFPVTYNGDVDAPVLGAMPATCGQGDAQGNTIMTTCPRLARGQGELFPNFAAAIGGHAYWIDGPNVKGELIGAMGTSFDNIAIAQGSSITAAAATTDSIYFADADPTDPTNGFIEKTGLAPNSTATLLARGQSSPLAVAVGATKVYWATSDCAIWSLNR
jgi:VCBS repeat-containing protein